MQELIDYFALILAIRKIYKTSFIVIIMKKELIFLLVFIVGVFSFYVSAGQNESAIVEANVFAVSSPEDLVSIEVPDYIFLGNVSEGEVGDKIRVYVNNTGSVDVTITPELKNSGDDVFENLYFQNRQSGNNSVIYIIGDYSFDIAKPSSSGVRSEYFWMWLDLSEVNGITEDRIGEDEEIIFVALPKS